jgi:hypothetical protein
MRRASNRNRDAFILHLAVAMTSAKQAMDPKEESALRDLYRTWPSERLVRAASHDRHEYRPEAVDCMLEELVRRGMTGDEASKLAASMPAQSADAPAPPKIVKHVAGYFRWKVFLLVIFIAGFGGLLLAELATIKFTGNENYYQEHWIPPLLGAALGYVLSFTAMKCLAWFVRWTNSGKRPDAPAPAASAAPKTDFELIGLACYAPHAFFVLAAIGPFLTR